MDDKRYVFSAFLLIAVFLAPSSLRSEPLDPEAEASFTLASGAFQTGRYESALAECRNFLKQFPHHRKAAAVRYIRAESYFVQDRFPEAAGEFQDVVGSAKGADANLSVSARYRLGECHFNLKKYLNALDDFSAVIKSPNSSLRAEALLGTAYCYLARGEHDKAEAALLKLLQSYSGYENLPKATVPLGLIYMEQGRYQDALELFSRAPGESSCLYYRGVCQRLLNRVIAASQLFKEALDKDTDKEWTDKALYQMGEAYFQSQEYPLAYDAFKKVFTEELKSPLRPIALFRMGCVNFQNGLLDQAGHNWSQLVQEFPATLSGPASQYLLAEIFLRQNELGKAITGFSGLLDVEEYSMDAQYKVIWSLAAQGQYDAAVTKADKFVKDIEWGELHAKALILKGLSQQKMNKQDDAIATYQSVLDRYPKTLYYEKSLFLMTLALVQQKRYAEVITLVYQVLKNSPSSPSRWQAETYYWVAESYYNMGQFEMSRQLYEMVAKNYPRTPLLPNVLLGVAASLARMGEYDKAIEAQAKAIEASKEMENPEVQRSALLDSADVLFNKREYDKAVSFYDEFVKNNAGDPRAERALYQMGLALYRQEYFTEAIRRWTQLTDGFKNGALAPDATFQTGRTYFGLGQYDAAFLNFKKVLDLYPQTPQAKEALLQLAQCRYNEGKIDEAILHYKAFLDKYPQDEKVIEVTELLQMAYYKLGKTPAELKNLAAQFPKSKFTADIYWEQGADAYNNKEYDKALDFFQRLILDFPDSSQALQAYYYKADSYFLKGDFAAAAVNFKNFIVNYPQDPLANDGRFKVAVAYFSLKDYLQSAVAFNDYVQAYPNDPKAKDASLNIPLCYSKVGQKHQAIDAYETYLRRYPQDEKTGFIQMQIGQAYEDLEDYSKAVETYKKNGVDKPESFEALFAMGRCYKKLKAPAEERKAYETLRGLDPKDNKFRMAGMVALGEIYEQSGSPQDAAGVYQDIASYSADPDWRAAAQEKLKALKGGK